MILILFTPLGVDPRRLEMTIGISTNPDVSPGGRNNQQSYPIQLRGDFNYFSLRIIIVKPVTSPLSGDSRRVVRNITQTGRLRRFSWVLYYCLRNNALSFVYLKFVFRDLSGSPMRAIGIRAPDDLCPQNPSPLTSCFLTNQFLQSGGFNSFRHIISAGLIHTKERLRDSTLASHPFAERSAGGRMIGAR